MVTLYWSHLHTWRGGRTYGLTDGRMHYDVIAKPKVSRIKLPYFLNHGTPRARAP